MNISNYTTLLLIFEIRKSLQIGTPNRNTFEEEKKTITIRKRSTGMTYIGKASIILNTT